MRGYRAMIGEILNTVVVVVDRSSGCIGGFYGKVELDSGGGGGEETS